MAAKDLHYYKTGRIRDPMRNQSWSLKSFLLKGLQFTLVATVCGALTFGIVYGITTALGIYLEMNISEEVKLGSGAATVLLSIVYTLTQYKA